MSKFLLTEYYELCPNGLCEDMLTEAEKQMVRNGEMFLTGVMQRAELAMAMAVATHEQA